MVRYHIPNLLGSNLLKPYIKPVNPNYDVLEAECVAWIDASSFLSHAQKKARLDWKHVELPLCVSILYPDSCVGPLRVALEHAINSMLLEHLSDTSVPVKVRNWADLYIQAFKQTLGDVEGPAAIFKDLTNRVLSAIKDPYQSDLVASNISMAEGIIKEATNRANPDTKITLEAYKMIRKDTIIVRPFLCIGRWIHNIDILPEVLKHPDVVKLEEQAIDLIFLTNDLYSYKREFFENGAVHNYVTVALGDPITGLHEKDRQGAIDYTCHKFFEILADFQRQKEILPSFGESEDAKIMLYIGVMMDLVVGNIRYCLSCQRYGVRQKAGKPDASNWGDVVIDMDSRAL